jgi:hypothetical protein
MHPGAGVVSGRYLSRLHVDVPTRPDNSITFPVEQLTMKTAIGEFELIDHGADNSQYFPGCGVAYTPYSHVATGCGSSAEEAVDDLIDMIAQGVDDNGNGWDVDNLESRLLADCGLKRWPRKVVKGEDCYYYVSLRWNEAEVPTDA